LTKADGKWPPPSDYLDQSFINAHEGIFTQEGVASRIVSKSAYNKFGIGKPDQWSSEFVSTKSDIDKVLNESGGDLNQIASQLGIPSSQLQGGLVRIDFDLSKNSVFMPSGNEWGANDLWIPSGILPTGKLESVVHTNGMLEGVDYIVKDL